MTETSIEYAPFSLKDGVSETALLEAAQRLEREFLSQADGYLGRFLVAEGDGRYADIVVWRSKADADGAAAAVESSEACRAFFACMSDADPADAGAGVDHYRVVSAFGTAAHLAGGSIS